jgi:hypothetical protein
VDISFKDDVTGILLLGVSFMAVWERNSPSQLFPEPVFLNVYGAQESIPRNKFRQPM